MTALRYRVNVLRRPRGGFTIVELTIVIGVLAVLLAIALPTVKSVHMTAERKKAAVQATILTQAVIKYKDVYGFWPGQLRVAGGAGGANPAVELRDEFKAQDWTPVIISRFGNPDFEVTATGAAPIYFGKNEQHQNQLYQALNTIDPESAAGGLYRPNPLNPRQIDFLDLKNATSLGSVGFPDPWGQEFIVFMGLNPRSRFTYTQTINGKPNYRISVSNCTAFAFSRGPDGDRSNRYIMTEGVNYEER